MTETASSATPKVTRESLLDVGKVVVAGSAIKLIVTIDDSGKERTSAVLEYLRTKEMDLEKRARTAIAAAFGDRKKNYILAPILFADSHIRLVLYGQGSETSTHTTYGGERWVERADKFQFLMRKNIQEILQGVPALKSILIDLTWEPGDGLLCSDYLVDPGSPDPALSAELRRLRDKESRFHRNRTMFFIVGAMAALAILIAFIAVYHLSGTYDRGINLFITAFLALYIVIPLAIFGISIWANYGGTEQEIYRKEANLDLRGVLGDDEQNAYKLFQVNSAELKRYYDQALKQRALVFSLGIFCIMGGFAVVGVTLYILTEPLAQASLNEKIVVGVLGAVGGILANFIAVIFLQMFRSIVTSMVDFHNRLVLTHHIYFGNLLLARVSDSALKEQTLSKLALALSSLYGPQTTNADVDYTGSSTKMKDSLTGKRTHFFS